MFLTKHIVAAVLLNAPAEAVAFTETAAWQAAFASSLQTLAIEWEILDRREVTQLLVNPQDFPADLKELQTRHRELSQAPFLEECGRFPQRTLVNELLSFNRALRNDLAARLLVDRVHHEELQAALQETDLLYRIWDTLRDARCQYYYVTVRRQALYQLRLLIGPEAFYSGNLPPHVPSWRFPSAN